MCVTEDSGHVEAEIGQHYANIRRRLKADYQAVLQKLSSLRDAETERLQTTISDLETSRLELKGLGERLEQLVSRGTDADIIQENVMWKWKPSGFDESGSDSGVVAFRENSLLTQHQSNIIGQVTSAEHAADHDGKWWDLVTILA